MEKNQSELGQNYTNVRSGSTDNRYVILPTNNDTTQNDEKPKFAYIAETSPGDDVVVPTVSPSNIPKEKHTESEFIDLKLNSTGEYSDTGYLSNNNPCYICADRGSGFHYSVYSCEGCKGFFKRTVQKNLVYVCKDNKCCVINKATRNNCQFCRFQKCLQNGMKREAVREDRTPGGKHGTKRHITDDQPTNSKIGPGNMLSTTGSAPGTSGPNLSAIYSLKEPYDNSMTQKLIDAQPDLMPSREGSTVDVTRLSINDLMEFGYLELRFIIEWARKVPGFGDLSIEDQMALLKSSFMELFVLRLAYRSLDLSNAVKFADGVNLSLTSRDDLGWGAELVKATLEFVSRVRAMGIDRAEFCILNSIVLTYPDASGVNDKDGVLALQSQFLDTLRKYSLHRYRTQPQRSAKLLLRLPCLRTVSAKAAERFLAMTLDGSIKMNALVLEIMT